MILFHESPNFVKNIDNFLFKSDEVSKSYLSKNKTKIPIMFRNYPKTLYRGLILDGQDFLVLQDGKYKTKISSWTKDQSITQKFINDPKYRIQSKNTNKIILQKKIYQQYIIIDIDSYFNFYPSSKLEEMGFDELNIDSALKEQEVLVSPVLIGKNEFKLY